MIDSDLHQEKWRSIETELKFVIEPQISPYGGPLFFARSLETPIGDSVIANGGFSLVDTGRKKLLVTCDHVWEGFQEERRKDTNVRMCVCLDQKQPVVFDQYDPIDHDKSLDIATFDIAPVLGLCGGRRFYPLNQNPAPRVAKGNRLVVLGNQGMFRSATEDGLCFGVTIYSLHVSSFSSARVVADLSKTKPKYVMKPMRTPTPGASAHGGISGTPCFLVRRNSQAHLVGFVTGDGMDSLWFTHFRCLNPDGTIKRMAS